MTESNENSASDGDDEENGRLDKIIDVGLELLGLI